MNLQEFINKHGGQEKAAKKLGLSQGMVSGRLTGLYPINPNAAIDLEKRSNGEMKRSDLLPEIFAYKSLHNQLRG
jgi:DNA-binding transcriptional regulator YdaS (Cro superfamily)